MAAPTDWPAWEERIAALLPAHDTRRNVAEDRPRLLRELSAYARAVVAEARDTGALRPGIDEIEPALDWLRRPVFLCGHHRSGTTLLSNLLDGHPELVVLPSEGTYLTSFRYAARPDPSPADSDRFAAEWVSRFVDPNYEPHFVLGRAGPAGSAEHPGVLFVRRLLGWHRELQMRWPERASFGLLLSLVAAFHAGAARSSAPRAPRRWVEKTPLNEHNVARLSAFEGARFIQLVRDPRATFASRLAASGEARPDTVEAAGHARSIGRSLRRAVRNERSLAGRYLVVRYEDLVGDPEREMERVRAFLEVSPHPSLTTPTVAGVPVRANSSFDAGAPGVISRAHDAREVSRFEGRLLGAFTASSARAFGYELPAPSLVPRAALRLWGEIAHASRVARERVANGVWRSDGD